MVLKKNTQTSALWSRTLVCHLLEYFVLGVCSWNICPWDFVLGARNICPWDFVLGIFVPGILFLELGIFSPGTFGALRGHISEVLTKRL